MFNRKIAQIIIFSILGIICLRFVLSPFGGNRTKHYPFGVRVRIMHNIKEIDVSSRSSCDVRDAETDELLIKKIMLKKGTKIKYTAEGIVFDNKITDSRTIVIIPFSKKDLNIRGTLYRGKIYIKKTNRGLDVINYVDLEDYLKGVVPKEIYSFWPFAAIKAQAIAARSYAVNEILRRKNKEYDLKADTYSQVYGGQSGETWRTSRAVDKTSGEVLEYKGRLLACYFHACCGGSTQNALRLWNEGSAPLRGVKCGMCRKSPHYKWQVQISANKILAAMRKKGFSITKIDNIKIGPRDKSGRIEYIRVKSSGKWYKIKTEDLRALLGRSVLKSSNFQVKKYPLFYIFKGQGWGHGVGMCQWGAFYLSLKRWKTEKILNKYYPGAKIISLQKLLEKKDE